MFRDQDIIKLVFKKESYFFFNVFLRIVDVFLLEPTMTKTFKLFLL